MRALTIETLASRIDRLELQNRCLKLTLFVAVATALALGLMGAAAPKTVEGEAFLVRDGKGVVRAELGMAKEKDAVRLTLIDATGVPRAGLAVTKDGPLFALFDEKNRMRVRLDSADDSSSVGLYDGRAQLQLLIIEGPDDRGVIEFFDGNGMRRGELGFTGDLGSHLEFWDSKEKLRASLFGDSDESSLNLTGSIEAMLKADSKEAALGFFDAERKSRAALQVDAVASTLGLFDPTRKMSAALGSTKSGPAVALAKDGKTLFAAP